MRTAHVRALLLVLAMKGLVGTAEAQLSTPDPKAVSIPLRPPTPEEIRNAKEKARSDSERWLATFGRLHPETRNQTAIRESFLVADPASCGCSARASVDVSSEAGRPQKVRISSFDLVCY